MTYYKELGRKLGQHHKKIEEKVENESVKRKTLTAIKEDYIDFVVPLCSLDNANANANFYFSGNIFLKRFNMASQMANIEMTCGKMYNATLPYCFMTSNDIKADILVRPITFTYNEKMYFGLYFSRVETYFSEGYARGEASDWNVIDCIAVYNNNTQSILNEEIYNSIAYTSEEQQLPKEFYTDPYVCYNDGTNRYKVITENDLSDYSKTQIVECVDYADMQAKIASGEYGEDTIFSTPDVNNILDSISDGSSTDVPIGHIMSFMGNNPPKHYLVCDGTEYNIEEYPHLAAYLLNEFGVYNYFGGDGITTFAVPDLRGEFLRGSGVALRNTGSGADVGVHQDGTIFSYLEVNQNNSLIAYNDDTRHLPKNIECLTLNTSAKGLNLDFEVWTQSVSAYQDYTSRPTNTSVLYCIKYEPTYNVNVTFNSSYKRDVLWEGEIRNDDYISILNTVTLTNSYINYDVIGVFYTVLNPIYMTNEPHYQELQIENITKVIEKNVNEISIIEYYANEQGECKCYTNLTNSSTSTSFVFRHGYSAVTKIVGIKY